MSFDSIIGQPLAVDLCRTWLKRQTTNPLLMYGPEGVGKKTLALVTAKALNCSEKGAGPCEACISCRKIASGNHPDVRLIDMAWQAAERKEPLEKQQNLRIETVLSERHRLLQSAVEGTWKVSIIDDAHRMTADAANVLLKILEEPPAHTAIFLVTAHRDRLFPTIISRCQPVRFRYLERTPTLTHEAVEAHRQAEDLWETLKKTTPASALHETGKRTKAAKPNRTDIEQQIQGLLVPAARALRTGDMTAVRPVRLIQSALTQLRQNVQPGLVYDNLLLQLARSTS